MKSTVADYKTLVHCMRIENQGGDVLRFVEYPHDLVMSNGEIYKSDSGYEFTGLSTNSEGSLASMDLTGLLNASGVTLDDLNSQKWDSAFIYVFATSWAVPVEDEEPLGKFIVGRVQVTQDKYTVQMMHLIDAINQPAGRNEKPTCDWTLFDETLSGKQLPAQKSRCGLAIADFTVSATVTSVTSNSVFTIDDVQADDYYAKGHLQFTSGNNNGLPVLKIKSYTGSPLQLTLHQAALKNIQVGDTLNIVPGCRHREIEDCQTKFNNRVNFGSAANMPSSDVITQIGQIS